MPDEIVKEVIDELKPEEKPLEIKEKEPVKITEGPGSQSRIFAKYQDKSEEVVEPKIENVVEPEPEEKPVEKPEVRQVKQPGLKVKLDDQTPEELKETVKQWMRISEKRKLAIEAMEAGNESIEKTFVNAFKKDAYSALREYGEDLGLPDSNFISKQFEQLGDIDSRIAQWQETTLTSEIEKKYKLDEGTFVFDPEDAYKKNTPSGMWRRETELMEQKMENESNVSKQKQTELISKLETARKENLDFIKESYYPDDDEAYIAKINEFDSIPEKIESGEMDRSMDPFAIKNIFRGVYFDSIVKDLLTAQANEMHEKYKSLGYKGEMPIDITQAKGETVEKPVHKMVSGTKFNRQRKVLQKYMNDNK
jgi:hypothetical protein